MNLQLKYCICKLLLLASLPVVFTGCGGGDGGGKTPLITISGSALKGPISAAKVAVYRVNADGGKGQSLGITETKAGGLYSLDIPATSGPVLVEVSGRAGATYLSESTNGPINFTETESFRAVTTNAATNQTITVSPLTEAAYNKMLQLLTLSPAKGIGDAIENGNKAVADLHRIGNILTAPDANYIAALLIIDKIIQTTPSANTTTVTAMLTAFVTATTTAGKAEYSAAVATAALALSPNPAVAEVAQAIQIAFPTPPLTINPPTTPTITSSTSTSNSVTLQWTASASTNVPPGNITYNVYRNGTYVAVTPDLTITDLNLLPATSYNYEVKAVDSFGSFSASSPVVTVTTKNAPVTPPPAAFETIPPFAPKNLKATAAPTGSPAVTLSWDAASPGSGSTVAVAGYELYRATSNSTASASLIASPTTTSYTDTTVLAEITYFYWVKAINANNIASVFGGPASAKPINNPTTPTTVTIGGNLSPDIFNLPANDIFPPTAPSNLAASTSALDATTSSVTLTWSAAADNIAVTGYDILRNNVLVGTSVTPGFLDPSVTSNVAHSYTIKAFDAAGNRSAASTPLSVTPNQASLGVIISGQVNPGLPQ